jgi:hypothetical protein
MLADMLAAKRIEANPRDQRLLAGDTFMSISFVLALLALVVTLINAANGRAPLWIAVALLALAMIIPGAGLLRV